MSFIQVFSDDEQESDSASTDLSLLNQNHNNDEYWNLINHSPSNNYNNYSPRVPPSKSSNHINSSAMSDQSTLSDRSELDSDTSYIDYFNIPESGPMSDITILDQLDTLPKKKTSGLKIDIFVTKTPPRAHIKNEIQHKLKEYTSGETVHGYIIIENNSSKPIPFEMFSISLEGTILNNQDNANISKKFLRLFDLTACYNYGYIPTTSAIKYSVDDIDAHDGSTLGFKDDKILAPKTKYKKFFSFKFPHTLLDTNCTHSQVAHCMLPPTFGVNRGFFKGTRVQAIVDPVLRYGHEDIRGSPLVVNDGCFKDCYVAYTVEAKVLGFANITESVSENTSVASASNSVIYEKSESRSTTSTKMSIIGDGNNYVRFIPYGNCGNCQPSISDRTSTKELEKLTQVVESTLYNTSPSSPIDFKDDTRDILDSHVDSCVASCSAPIPTPLIISTEKSLTKKKITLFKSSSTSKDKGVVKASCTVPTKGIPYVKPSILNKFNTLSSMSVPASKNISQMYASLDTNATTELTTIDLNLEYFCASSPNGVRKDLPRIDSVGVELHAVNFRSRYSIPIKITSDLVGKVGELERVKSKYKGYLTKIKSGAASGSSGSLYGSNSNGSISGSSTSGFPRHLYNDIRSIIDLNTTTQSYPIYKPTYTHSLWETSTTYQNSQGAYFGKKLTIKLNRQRYKDVLLPGFQSCLVGRCYFLVVKISLGGVLGSDDVLVNLPVTVRSIDY